MSKWSNATIDMLLLIKYYSTLPLPLLYIQFSNKVEICVCTSHTWTFNYFFTEAEWRFLLFCNVSHWWTPWEAQKCSTQVSSWDEIDYHIITLGYSNVTISTKTNNHCLPSTHFFFLLCTMCSHIFQNEVIKFDYETLCLLILVLE